MSFFGAFLRERIYPVLFGIGVIAVCAVVMWLYGIPLGSVGYCVLLGLVFGGIIGTVDFIREFRHHKVRMAAIRTAEFERESIPDEYGTAAGDYAELTRVLWDRVERLTEEKIIDRKDARDYYTTWVHQIKTPISVMQMLVKSEDTELTRAMAGELFRTEQYVDMALGYIRLGEDSADLLIRECNLDELIRGSIRRFAPQFIARKLTLSYEPREMTVVTDGKWFAFLLEQLISNAVKYTYEGGVTISITEDAKVIVRDTGIGISPEDIPRIFEKGYTGFNGRMHGDGKATGLGLYLCDKIAKKLGVGLSVSSEVGKGTEFTIDMKKDKITAE